MAVRIHFARPLSALALGALTAFAAPARANGRFPNAQQVREVAPDSLVVAGTYGLLVTTNAGADFAFVCEPMLFGRPAETTTVDPLLELGPGGSILSGSLESARISRDQGCTFEPIASLPRDWSFFETEPPPGAENGLVLDLSRRGTGLGASVVALVALFDEQGAITEHRVYEAPSGDDFRPVGEAISLSDMDFGTTLDAAPSDPDRIYVSGSLRGAPVVLVSRDGASSFTPGTLAPSDPSNVLGAYIAAVSPDDPERLYVRVLRRIDGENGLYNFDDSLLVSDDGGTSFSEPLRARANFLGFALSPKGDTILAGFGDPSATAVLSDPTAVGLYRADAGDLVFTKIVDDLDVTCLSWQSSGLYVCAAERDPLEISSSTSDFHLGVFRGSGLPSSADDFTPLLELRDVRGPPPWLDGHRTVCDDEWQTSKPNAPVPTGSCAPLNACGPRPELSAGALVCGQASGGGAGVGGAGAGGADDGGAGDGGAGDGGASDGGASDGGAPGTGGTAANGGSQSAGAPNGEAGEQSGTPNRHADSGCDCRLNGRRRSGWPIGLTALFPVVIFLVRRAKRRAPARGPGAKNGVS